MQILFLWIFSLIRDFWSRKFVKKSAEIDINNPFTPTKRNTQYKSKFQKGKLAQTYCRFLFDFPSMRKKFIAFFFSIDNFHFFFLLLNFQVCSSDADATSKGGAPRAPLPLHGS